MDPGESVKVVLDVAKVPELLANVIVSPLLQNEVTVFLKRLSQCLGLVSISFAFASVGYGTYYLRNAFDLGRKRPTADL